MGFVARYVVTKPIKAEAILDATKQGNVWSEGKGSLLKKRVKKVVVERTATNVMSDYAEMAVRDAAMPGGGNAVQGIQNVDKLGDALAAGATAAAREPGCERTTDAAKLRLSTRKFIKVRGNQTRALRCAWWISNSVAGFWTQGDLQRNLVVALKLLHTQRPADDEVKDFLVAALQGKKVQQTAYAASAAHKEADDDAQGVYQYFATNGVFSLLKPALLSLDKQRPANPTLYLATFLAETIAGLK
jgi:hypothetical protein